MQISISAQCLLFVASVVLGFLLFFLYEPFRILRLAFAHKTWLIAAQDFLFCLFSAFCQILVLYTYGDGGIRWFALFGTALGSYLYYFSLGKLISRFAPRLISAIGAILLFLKVRMLLPAIRLITRFWRANLAFWQRRSEKHRARRIAAFHKRVQHTLPRRASHGFRRF